MEEKILNIPNFLTFLRLLAIPYLVYFITTGDYFLSVLIFILASLTDIFDGRISRKKNLKTNFGQTFDTVVDVLFLTTILILFFIMKTIDYRILIIVLIAFLFNLSAQIILMKRKKQVLAQHVRYVRPAAFMLYVATGIVIVAIPFFELIFMISSIYYLILSNR